MREVSTKGKKLKLKEYRCTMGLFEFAVICVVGDYKKIEEYVCWKFDDKDFNLESWDNGYECRGKCFYRRGYVPIIWIPRSPQTNRELATFAHECLHAVFHMFEWAGLPVTRDTEEVMTHAQAHLVNTFLDDLN